MHNDNDPSSESDTLNIVILGDTGVGKTNLITSYAT